MKRKLLKNLVIYQTKSGAFELRGDVQKETIWASLDQIAQAWSHKSVISKHLKIYSEGELGKGNCCKNATVQIEVSARYREIEYTTSMPSSLWGIV
jgi:hypothetical protein